MERIYNSYWYIRAMLIGCIPPVTDFHPLAQDLFYQYVSLVFYLLSSGWPGRSPDI